MKTLFETVLHIAATDEPNDDEATTPLIVAQRPVVALCAYAYGVSPREVAHLVVAARGKVFEQKLSHAMRAHYETPN